MRWEWFDCPSYVLVRCHKLCCLSSLKGLDVRSMGRIFIGLVKCGAWGCFDEFNRLEEAVLSAVSMQIQSIQASIRSRANLTHLLGKEVQSEIAMCYSPFYHCHIL